MMRKKCIYVLVILCMCVNVLWGCGFKKNDLDKMVGTWGVDEGTMEMTIYEADDEKSGDLEIVQEGEVTYGTYEWHESSQRIVFSIIDGWGAIVDVNYNYEFLDDDSLNINEVDSKEEPIKFKRIS